jgi:hypothetical protein
MLALHNKYLLPVTSEKLLALHNTRPAFLFLPDKRQMLALHNKYLLPVTSEKKDNCWLYIILDPAFLFSPRQETNVGPT